MSTTTAFKFRGPDKRAPFPFCREDATAPSGTVDYIALTPTAGDEGLAEAMRMWWLMESAQLYPHGAVDAVYFQDILTGLVKGWGTGTNDFEEFYGDTFDTAGAGTLGSKLEAHSPSHVTLTVEPYERMCFSSDDFYTSDQRNGDLFLCNAHYFTSGGFTDGAAQFTIAYVSSEWRLYYKFLFTINTGQLDLGNPASIASPTDTGDFDFYGYTLNFAYYLGGSSLDETPAIVTDLTEYTF